MIVRVTGDPNTYDLSQECTHLALVFAIAAAIRSGGIAVIAEAHE